MRSTFAPRFTLSLVAVMAVTTLTGLVPAALTMSARERFTAFAVDIGVPGRTSAGPVEIVVERVLDRR